MGIFNKIHYRQPSFSFVTDNSRFIHIKRGVGFQPAIMRGVGFQPAIMRGVGFQPAIMGGIGFQPAIFYSWRRLPACDVRQAPIGRQEAYPKL
ncbi:hypothetical protein Q31b_06230 [Novipirellula aureliae]|uniref:Uncharacterized protein n=1 Tax=Novipirellula aureliae TaxID=2527966 RepID=A0A5C6ECF8_9BACT|nr:hypothetical protein Q31b_06230 [Novipirellula aureliae]